MEGDVNSWWHSLENIFEIGKRGGALILCGLLLSAVRGKLVGGGL